MSCITMVTSGKGGVGKSGCCVMLGLAMSRQGKKVLIIELDNALKSLDIMMGICDNTVFDINDVLTGRCAPIKAIYKCDYAEQIYLMPASSEFNKDITKEDIFKLCKGLSGYFDCVILDTPAGVGETFKAAAMASDSAIIVATADIICVRDAQTVSSMLYEYGVENQRLIINRLKPDKLLINLPDLDYVIDTVGVQLLGIVPENDVFAKRISSGEYVSINNDVSRVYENIAKRLNGEYVSLFVKD